MDFETLEDKIKEYLLLADNGIIKLLCAVVIANRIPALDPIWLFIVSNSSGGKSELLSALAYVKGTFEQDDLTPKAFLSGMKNNGKETSLLFRMPENSIMLIKDLTLLLDKDQRESGQIFSQLRLIYDGKLTKSFGTGEDLVAIIKMGLIAGVTSVIEDTQAKQASMGQRTIKYYMKQPDALEVTRLGIKGKNDKEKRKMMGEAFKEFIDNNKYDLENGLPDLPPDTEENIVRLAEMSTRARSSIKRQEYSREKSIERKDLREMPLRMAKQLASIGRALIIINKSTGKGATLTGLDNRIIYQLALDSIPSARREVMMSATKFEQVTLEGLSLAMKLPNESVKIHLDDLVALEIINKHKGINNKMHYELRVDYRALIAKFEDIEMTNETLDEQETLPPEPPITTAERYAEEAGII